MAKVARTIGLAIFYFVVPLVLCLGLVAIGAFSGRLILTNLGIFSLCLVCLLAASLLSLRWKRPAIASALFCSSVIIAVSFWRFGEERIRRELYVAQILFTPQFDKKCGPAEGISFNEHTVRFCSVHDFNAAGWIDLIVKITGPDPKERLIDYLNAGKIGLAAQSELIKLGLPNFVWPDEIVGQRLSSDYYLIKYHLCGNKEPYC